MWPVFMVADVTWVHSQDYPVRDIKVLSGQAAGSGADFDRRFCIPKLSSPEASAQRHRRKQAGHLGSLAGEALARAAPDGYRPF